MILCALSNQSNANNESPNPLKLWTNIEEKSVLRDIALRLLQVVPNTAAIERLFSIWSLLDTDSAAKRHFQATAQLLV